MSEADLTHRIIDQRFRIDKLIARGGMGAVYKATQLSVDRPVAVKIIRQDAQHTINAQRFLREAMHISQLSHPNIVSLIDFGHDEDMAYLVMEYVEGVSLDAYMSARPMAAFAAVDLLLQICSGLVQAHMQGLVHRDLKPDNILCIRLHTGELQVKIVDFGIAHASETSLNTLTQEGDIVGTPRYMSPEQALGRPLDARSDLFSLGIIAQEMLSGAPPFDAPTPLQLMMQICHTPHTPLSNPSIPAELIELIDALLEKEPDARPASAMDVIQALQRIQRDHALPAILLEQGVAPEFALLSPQKSRLDVDRTEDASPSPPAPKTSPALPLLAACVVLSVLVAGSGLVYLVLDSPPTQATASEPSPSPTLPVSNHGSTSTPVREQVEQTPPPVDLPISTTRARVHLATERADARARTMGQESEPSTSPRPTITKPLVKKTPAPPKTPPRAKPSTAAPENKPSSNAKEPAETQAPETNTLQEQLRELKNRRKE